jgi:hypothetical protein
MWLPQSCYEPPLRPSGAPQGDGALADFPRCSFLTYGPQYARRSDAQTCPGLVGCENAWDRYARSPQPAGPEKGPATAGWVSRELRPLGSSAYRLSFWLWRTILQLNPRVQYSSVQQTFSPTRQPANTATLQYSNTPILQYPKSAQ